MTMNVLEIPNTLSTRKNLFIYFDFEREFGGHNTSINDKDITEILRLLGANSVKTTWFTVGKIFSQYPDSIMEVISEGHELGSHTYSHIAPLDVSCSVLKDDFLKFSEASSSFNTEIVGFHSPNSRWSLKLLKLLRDNNFIYDLVHCKRRKKCNAVILGRKKLKKIIRLQTVGDDWPVYGRDLNTQEVFDHFKKLLDRIGKGEIAGIGFHPWVVFSDNRIFDGFSLFLNYVFSSGEYCIKPAKDYVSDLMGNINGGGNQ